MEGLGEKRDSEEAGVGEGRVTAWTFPFSQQVALADADPCEPEGEGLRGAKVSLHPVAGMSGTDPSFACLKVGVRDGLRGWTVSWHCASSVCDLSAQNHFRRTPRKLAIRGHGKMR